MPHLKLNLFFLATCLVLSACSAATDDDLTNQQVEQNQDAEDNAVTENNQEDPDCDLTVETRTGIIVAETHPAPLDANSTPLICWTNPDNAPLPTEPDGWSLRIEREEVAGTEDIAETHWHIDQGIPAELTELPYGDCPATANRCTSAKPLTEGTYFLHLFDAGRPDGLAASLVFQVQSQH